jgi:hypothetical protein
VKNPTTYVLFGIAIWLSSGCATEPTLGDKMLNQSESTKQMGIKWTRGQELVIDGEKLQKKGYELVEKGKELQEEGAANIEEGDRLISQGRRLIEESESAYKAKFPGSPKQ